jgi:alpha-beta hydrolase superfamily lysophospholipase
MIPIAQNLHDLPVLYLTGESDDLAKSEEVRFLFEKTASKRRRLVYIPDAGHEDAYEKYPVVYQRALREFLGDLKKGPSKPMPAVRKN